jgi:hypothetical protein
MRSGLCTYRSISQHRLCRRLSYHAGPPSHPRRARCGASHRYRRCRSRPDALPCPRCLPPPKPRSRQPTQAFHCQGHPWEAKLSYRPVNTGSTVISISLMASQLNPERSASLAFLGTVVVPSYLQVPSVTKKSNIIFSKHPGKYRRQGR